VIDLDHNVKHTACIGGTWDVFLFYSTDANSASVYTAKAYCEYYGYYFLEWSLHRFSETTQLEQVKKDSFEFPGFIQSPTLNRAIIAHSSHVVLKMRCIFYARQGFVHSVECPGEYFLLKTVIYPGRRRRLVPLLLGGTKQLSEFQST
jgi:hypothetical protein